MLHAEADKVSRWDWKSKCPPIAGSEPELHSYLPRRGQEKRQEAAAVIPPRSCFRFYFYFSQEDRSCRGWPREQKKDRRKG